MANVLSWTTDLFGWAALFPVVVFAYASASRTKTTVECQRTMAEAANSLRLEASHRNMQDDGTFQGLHRLVTEAVALAPAVAAGLVRRARRPQTDSDLVLRLEQWLEHNAWSLELIGIVHASLLRLEFHARPWSPSTWPGAFKGWFFVRFLAKRKAGAIVPSPERAAKDVIASTGMAMTGA